METSDMLKSSKEVTERVLQDNSSQVRALAVQHRET